MIDNLNFQDSFHELGIKQLINCSTHNEDKVFDLLLTNNSSLVRNIKVLDNEVLCKSDHYTISFSVACKVNHLRSSKRKIYNYKRNNWDQLNSDIGQVDWRQTIDCMERLEPAKQLEKPLKRSYLLV